MRMVVIYSFWVGIRSIYSKDILLIYITDIYHDNIHLSYMRMVYNYVYYMVIRSSGVGIIHGVGILSNMELCCLGINSFNGVIKNCH